MNCRSLRFSTLLYGALTLLVIAGAWPGRPAHGAAPEVPDQLTGSLTVNFHVNYNDPTHAQNSMTVTFTGTLNRTSLGYSFFPHGGYPGPGALAGNGSGSADGYAPVTWVIDHTPANWQYFPDEVDVLLGDPADANPVHLRLVAPLLFSQTNTGGPDSATEFVFDTLSPQRLGSGVLFGFDVHDAQAVGKAETTSDGHLKVTFNASDTWNQGSYVIQAQVSGSFTDLPPCPISITANPEEICLPVSTAKIPPQTVTFIANTDPANAPVQWGGDLGTRPRIQGHTVVTTYSTAGAHTVQATCTTSGVSTTATVHVMQAQFERQDAKTHKWTKQSTFRVGKAGDRDRRQHWRATLKPASEVSHVDVSNSHDLSVSGVVKDAAGGHIEFDLEGTQETDPGAPTGSTAIWLHHPDTTAPCGKISGAVVIPKFIASQTPVGGMQTHQWIINNATTPSTGTLVPDGKGVEVTWRGWLVRVKVLDQFRHECGDLYEGAAINESFPASGSPSTQFPIWRTLSAAGDYLDPVGYLKNDPASVLVTFTAVNHQPGVGHKKSVGLDSTDHPSHTVLQVFADEFQLQPRLVRDITPTPPNRVSLKLSTQ